VSTGTEAGSGRALDWAKWLVVGLLVAGGVIGNWYFQDQSILLRVIGLVVIGAAAVYVGAMTEKGAAAWDLLREARGEIRRVVWPSNQETTQTTIVVLVLIVLFSLLLWLLDWMLSSLVAAVIG
jgi:preprotein translocase subunit SecE